MFYDGSNRHVAGAYTQARDMKIHGVGREGGGCCWAQIFPTASAASRDENEPRNPGIREGCSWQGEGWRRCREQVRVAGQEDEVGRARSCVALHVNSRSLGLHLEALRSQRGRLRQGGGLVGSEIRPIAQGR